MQFYSKFFTQPLGKCIYFNLGNDVSYSIGILLGEHICAVQENQG